MTGERDLVSDVDIDLAGLLGEVWRRKLLIGVVTALSAILLFIGLSTVDPRYRSDARIIIEKRESVFTRRSDGDFNLSNSQANAIMLNVHRRGIGVCGIYSYEVAEAKATKVMEYARQNEHPLQLQLEKE